MANQQDVADFMEEIGKSVALGLVPFVGQAIDIYDTAYAAYDLYNCTEANDDQKEEAYFGMAMAAIGWIPGPGDGIKKTLKTVNKHPEKYAPLLLDAVRQALYTAGYKVDPYQFLMDSINAGKIKSIINGAKADIVDSSVFKRCPTLVQQGMIAGLGLASQSIPAVVGVVEKRVKKWLKVAPKSTASSQHLDHAKAPPTKQQGGKDQVGLKGKNNAIETFAGGTNVSQIAMANLNQTQESVGEHIADYYCHDHLAWGKHNASTAAHDKGETTRAKLTDGRHLSKLTTDIKARGVGIDAIWKSGSTPLYAIVEHKARQIYIPAPAMKSLLVRESAQEGSQKVQYRTASKQHRKIQKVGPPPTAHPTKPETDVPKMSHKWIEDRVKSNLILSKSDKNKLLDTNNYSRHVIHVVTSTGAGKTHREALDAAKEVAKTTNTHSEVEASKHPEHTESVHNYTNVFTEYRDDAETTPSEQGQPVAKDQKKSAGNKKKRVR
jgi:hypothetical protein